MSTFDCAAFDRRLDDGTTPDAAMLAHATTCARCAAALAAMAELDTLLATAPTAPDGFTATVMARVTPRRVAAPALEPSPAPWWFDILLQPTVVLSTIALGLVVWRARALFAAVEVGAAWIANAATSVHVSNAALSVSMAQWTMLAVALGLAPVFAYAMYAISGWITGWTTRRTR